MKIIELHERITEKHENHRSPRENHEKHENLKTRIENYGIHENN